MSARPIRPGEIPAKKQETIPAAVFEVFNALIVECSRGGRALVFQKDVVERLKKNGLNIGEAFKKGWLDIESAYRAQGWEVKYDSPGFNESYDATFEFRSGKKNRQ